MNYKMMSLDPATHKTGYAIHTITGTHCLLDQFGVIAATENTKGDNDSKLEKMNFRSSKIVSHLRPIIAQNQISMLIMEFPEFQGRRALGIERQVNAVRMLAFICGKIVADWELHQTAVVAEKGAHSKCVDLITPVKWKGQVPKTVTKTRCISTYKLAENDDNITDAVMLGCWWAKKRGLTPGRGKMIKYDAIISSLRLTKEG